MKLRHASKGPFGVERDHEDFGEEYWFDCGVFSIVAKDGTRVGLVPAWDERKDPVYAREACANAYLLAAAPEMHRTLGNVAALLDRIYQSEKLNGDLLQGAVAEMLGAVEHRLLDAKPPRKK